MNRAEHLAWAKKRAIEYVDMNPPDLTGALASFMSDMTKHEETRSHPALSMMMGLRMSGHLDTPDEMKKHINDFA